MAADPPRPAEASQDERPAARRRPRWRLVVLGAAAVAASWNPIAAPIGLVVGAITAILAVVGLRREREGRRARVAALALSTFAILTSVVVLVASAGGVGADLGGEPVVKGRSAAELDKVLSEAAGRTRERRERAIQELDAEGARPATTPPRTPPATGAAPAPATPPGRP